MVRQTIILAFILAAICRAVHSVTLQSDIRALRALKIAVDPSSVPESSYLHSWDFSADPCESSGKFLGVLCSYPLDNSSNRVVEIVLDGAGYDGFLTASIGNLTELTILNLSMNNFRGPIPETISRLRKLTRISLSQNFFTGSIPTGITRLRELTSINLSQNRLSGSFPDQISKLRRLTRLTLSSNLLTGAIPALNGLWKLSILELDNNQFYGNIPKLPTNLRTLSMSHNVLMGHISSIRRLKKLISLDLSDNRLSGTIVYEILTFPDITRVNLSSNQFTSIEVVRFTGKNSRLREIDVEGNFIEERLPINLATYENLVEINLSSNRFFGMIPREYGRKLGNSWRRLYLDNNYLNGPLPWQFRNNETKVSGSLANNCLDCPNMVRLCRGGQKSESRCARYGP